MNKKKKNKVGMGRVSFCNFQLDTQERSHLSKVPKEVVVSHAGYGGRTVQAERVASINIKARVARAK